MTKGENKPSIAAVKDLMGANHEALRKIVQDFLQDMLEGEMTEALGASKSERSDGRIGYRSGHYNRTLITRVGKLETSKTTIGERGKEERCENQLDNIAVI